MDLETYIKNQLKIRDIVEERPDKLQTIRQIARKLRLNQDLVLQMVEDDDALMYNIGFQAGNGIYMYPRIGDYTIEPA